MTAIEIVAMIANDVRTFPIAFLPKEKWGDAIDAAVNAERAAIIDDLDARIRSNEQTNTPTGCIEIIRNEIIKRGEKKTKGLK
jgi:hypothetical protein